MTKRPSRTNPGRVELYADMFSILREFRRELIEIWLVLAGALILINLVSWGRWIAGLMSGLLVGLGVAGTLWVVWYLSGLGNRLEGTWAERFTAEELEKVTSETRVINSVRFDGFDIDHAVVARHGIYVIETKRHRALFEGMLDHDANRLARNGRTFRLFLTKSEKRVQPLPADVFTNVLVVWGKAGLDMLPFSYEARGGAEVVVVGGFGLAEWLSLQGRGTLPISQVDEVATVLEAVADEREREHAPTSRVVRWLARVR